MLLITNLQLEREINYKEHKIYIYIYIYILSLHTSDSKFTNDMDFWIFSITLVLFCAS